MVYPLDFDPCDPLGVRPPVVRRMEESTDLALLLFEFFVDADDARAISGDVPDELF